jgi:GAF domain-containing protein
VTVRIDDVVTDERWRPWCSAVTPLGVRAVLSVPLVAGGTGLGAIKVYSDQPGSFDDRADRVLELFARQAAVLLANTITLADAHRTNSQLTEALHHRDVIGQAKGILLARGAVDDTEAFAMLITASQRGNVKLYEVARRLVASVTGPAGDLAALDL